MTQAVSDTPRTDAVLSSDHYAKDLLELARTLERELAALRDRLARLPSDTPLVYLTALEHENDSLRALREGVPRDAMTDVVRRLYKWLEAPSDKGGCNLDHVPQSFMDAWQDADLRLEEIDRRAAQEGTPTGSEP
jgi:hypothetical protein